MAEVSLADLERADDLTKMALRWATKNSNAERVALLETCLDFAYNQLVDGRKHNQDHSEDALNVQIVGMLRAYSIEASHDSEVGGNCDILVRAPGDFLWIGEAKLHNGAKYVLGGFSQLSTRYGAAQPGRDHGEIIIYCRTHNIVRALAKWKALLVEEDEVVVTEDEEDQPLFFRTSHKCRNTGLPFYVRHRIIPLHHNPAK